MEERLRFRVRLTPSWWASTLGPREERRAALGVAVTAIVRRWPGAEALVGENGIRAVREVGPEVRVVDHVRERNALRREVEALGALVLLDLREDADVLARHAVDESFAESTRLAFRARLDELGKAA